MKYFDRHRTGALLIAGVLNLFGCAPPVQTTPAPSTATSTAAATRRPPPAVHWFRNSAEMRGLYLEIYRAAGDQLERLASTVAPQTWAVILDADETVLDNSAHGKSQDEMGAAYSDSAWRTWVYQRAAPALPGAVQFTRLVQQLGGRVVIVTNREQVLCDATRENLRSDSIAADLVLCRTTTGNKNPRFAAVAAGTASPSHPALKVIMWVGDNIQDFPNLTQSLRDRAEVDYTEFGRTYFLLPNPMYGSWEKVPYR